LPHAGAIATYAIDANARRALVSETTGLTIGELRHAHATGAELARCAVAVERAVAAADAGARKRVASLCLQRRAASGSGTEGAECCDVVRAARCPALDTGVGIGARRTRGAVARTAACGGIGGTRLSTASRSASDGRAGADARRQVAGFALAVAGRVAAHTVGAKPAHALITGPTRVARGLLRHADSGGAVATADTLRVDETVADALRGAASRWRTNLRLLGRTRSCPLTERPQRGNAVHALRCAAFRRRAG